jgi:hypothetical protein
MAIKLKTNYDNSSIDDMDTIYIRISKTFGTTGMGIVGNSNITYEGSSAVNCVAGGAAWREAKGDAEGGNEMQIKLAETTLITFKGLVRGIALQSNVLLGGNLLGLTSTGLTMAKPGEEVGEMDQPTISSIEAVHGVPENADVTFDTSEKTCYGTHINVKNVATGIIVYSHSKHKHIVRVSGFLHAVDYMVQVAYDGTDETIVWSNWFPFLGQ